MPNVDTNAGLLDTEMILGSVQIFCWCNWHKSTEVNWAMQIYPSSWEKITFISSMPEKPGEGYFKAYPVL